MTRRRTEDRRGVPRRPRLRVFALALALGLGACASTAVQSTTETSFAQRYADFTYAEVEVVRQSEARSCGLAVLASVLRYWDIPVTEAELLARHPIGQGAGHSLQTLQSIAQEHGLLGFTLSMSASATGTPARQLSEQIAKGRPVIVAVRLPQGPYFGREVPVLGTLDARTLRPFGIVPSASGQEFKLHYVIVFGEDATRYLLMDPAYGIVSVPKASLLAWWRELGYAALLCSPAPAPTDPASTTRSASTPPSP